MTPEHRVLAADDRSQAARRILVLVGISLVAIGGENWLATLAVTAAVFGVYSQTPAPALIGAIACGVAGLTVAAINDYQSAAIQKLGARNRVEAAEIAQQKGWL